MKTEKTFYFNEQKMLNFQKKLGNAVYAQQNPVNCPKLIFIVPEDIKF